MMLEQDIYWDRLDQSGPRKGLYINQKSYDGTQVRSYSKDPCMIFGTKPLNILPSTELSGMDCQSTSMYILNAIVPLTESKVALESAYAMPVSHWDEPNLVLRPKGRPPLKVVNIDVQDDSSCSKADKCTGTSSTWFCWDCTMCKGTWRAGLEENQLVDDDTLVMVVEPDADSDQSCTHTENCQCNFKLVPTREAVRYPIKARPHEDADCKKNGHRYWDHSCTCKSILGQVILEHFDHPISEYEASARADRLLMEEEARILVADFDYAEKEGSAAKKKRDSKKMLDGFDAAIMVETDEDKLDELMLVRALCKEAIDGRGNHRLSQGEKEDKAILVEACLVKLGKFDSLMSSLEGEDPRAVHDPKHWNHDRILSFAKRFTYGQTGLCLNRNGNTMKVNDPFHLIYNTWKGQDFKILINAFESHGVLIQLQLFFIKAKLRHIDIGCHAEAWLMYIRTARNRGNIKPPAETREELNGKEVKEVFGNYEGAIDLLLDVALDKELATKTAAVLRRVHNLFKPLFSHLKATKNFLPLVNGEVQNPSEHYSNSVSEYHDYFIANVNASNGFTIKGLDLLMQPWHIMKDHAPKWIRELHDKYGVYYGELSCEVVEHMNKVVCTHLENNTNNHEKKTMDKIQDNKYFQTLRHFMLQIFCYAHTLFKKKRKNLTCSVCQCKGHMKNNEKRCKLNAEYKPGYGIVYN